MSLNARQLRSLLKELKQEHLFDNWPAKHSPEDEARFFKQLGQLNDSCAAAPGEIWRMDDISTL
jgi:hypothetical protein